MIWQLRRGGDRKAPSLTDARAHAHCSPGALAEVRGGGGLVQHKACNVFV